MEGTQAFAAFARLGPGAMLAGSSILRCAGRGGMAAVWEARTRGGERVAIKTMFPALAMREALDAMFVTEGRSMRGRTSTRSASCSTRRRTGRARCPRTATWQRSRRSRAQGRSRRPTSSTHDEVAALLGTPSPPVRTRRRGWLTAVAASLALGVVLLAATRRGDARVQPTIAERAPPPLSS